MREEIDRIRTLQQQLTDGLLGLMDTRGAITDPVTNQPSPHDHYAYTFTALACALARNPRHDSASRLVAYYSGIPRNQTGHGPFNRLALLLMTRHSGNTFPEAFHRHIDTALPKAELADNYRSNNWSVLAALCRLLSGVSHEARQRAADELGRMSEYWMTAEGGFIDYPAVPGNRCCTPLTYHAKVLFCLITAHRTQPDSGLGELADRALRWIDAFTDDGGAAGGFGRSTHALFGYGALLSVYVDGLIHACDAESQAAWARRCGRLRELLEAQTRPDGLVSLNLNPLTGAAGGWDPYMYLTVYNAWTAGLLGWSLNQTPPQVLHQNPGTGALPCPEPVATLHDEDAGLVSVRSSRGQAGISTTGQIMQIPPGENVETRYAPLMPFNFVWDNKRLVPAPARFPQALAARTPAVAGWAPLFRHRGAFYTLGPPEAVQVHIGDGCALTLGLAVLTLNCGPRNGRLLHQRIAGRLREIVRGQYPRSLMSHRVTYGIWLDLKQGTIASVLVFGGGETQAVQLLNPFGHALTEQYGHRVERDMSVQSPEGVNTMKQGDLVSALIPSSVAGARGFAARPMAWPAAPSALSLTISLSTDVPASVRPLRYQADRNVIESPAGAFPLLLDQ